jgi:translation initiation factor IF-3
LSDDVVFPQKPVDRIFINDVANFPYQQDKQHKEDQKKGSPQIKNQQFSLEGLIKDFN